MNLGNRLDIAVVDTDVVSKLERENDLDASEFYREKLWGRDLVVSFLTVHEVRFGIANAGFGPIRTEMVLSDLHTYDVEWASEELIEASVKIRMLTRNQQLSTTDLFVASTALMLNCPLATDDSKLVAGLTAAGITGIISRHLPPPA